MRERGSEFVMTFAPENRNTQNLCISQLEVKTINLASVKRQVSAQRLNPQARWGGSTVGTVAATKINNGSDKREQAGPHRPA